MKLDNKILKGDSFVSLKNYNRVDILNVMRGIASYDDQNLKRFIPNKKKLIANLFYEPSTRTSSSFYAAATYLGHEVLSINNVQYSSVAKGESLEDTIRTLASYVHCIILRHPEEGSAYSAVQVSDVPIINAGDGIGEHPTQTLLDLYTIYKKFKRLDQITVALMGDLKYGRTIHSLIQVLDLFDVHIHLIGPHKLKLPFQYYKKEYIESTILTEDIAMSIDVLYITRVQKERGAVGDYAFTREDAMKLDNNCIVMHPLPRNEELGNWFDLDPRAKYFEQMSNGLAVRKYLLGEILG
jgi:aspartate carbamoyltransferase catalytic subunit